MDVKATFLNGELDEEIYTNQLNEFVAKRSGRYGVEVD